MVGESNNNKIKIRNMNIIKAFRLSDNNTLAVNHYTFGTRLDT